MKIGDKAKVIDKESLLYNKTVELIAISDDAAAYIFHSEDKKLKLVVHKDAIQRAVEWESSPDRGENKQGSNKTQHWITRGLLNRNLAQIGEERKKQVLANTTLGIVQRYCEEMPNKMEVVAALFGKKLGERFTVERDHDRFDCEFATSGLMARGAYENPYMNFDCFILEDLLTGRAVIVND